MNKILFVANVDKEHILKFHIPTIKRFVENGWQVDVACAGNEDIPYITNRFRMNWKRNPISLFFSKGVRELKKIIENNNYNIVYCHTPTGGVAARLASKKMRKQGLKVIYFAHGFHFYKGAPLFNWMFFYPIEKRLSKYTDLLITINDEDYHFALRHFYKKIDVFLSKGVGVDLSRFSSENYEEERKKYRNEFNINNNTVCLGYVAEIIKNKNQTMLLKCLELLKEKQIDAKLMLVGPDHTGGKFKSKISKKGLNDHVICTGWRNDTNSIISAFDFCTPSSLREGLGLNVVEAMEKGISVVANDNRGHRTIIKNKINGILVPKNDYRAMANSIEELLHDAQLHDSLIKQAHIDAKEYEQQVVVEKLFNKINEIIKK